ncbi:ATP-binding protein [Actinoplanes oblitus]|uniref:ATP-binding protein n=1 Tax=Actinoplanes oblitus TaxID=3040509 RepID=A0ABY8WIA9_9ACTN|nr:ATP-binding protein [Actinoplanes oblitus]WIM97222.1 ATP-binding protein [Actinoplanes oblitus]
MDTGYLVPEDSHISCANNPDTGVTEVSVHGSWDPQVRTAMAQTLRMCVAETPRLLLIDVARLSDPAGESLTTWQIAHQYARERTPPVDVVMCAPTPRLRHRLSGTAGGVTIAVSLDAARAAGPRQPIWPQRRTRPLPADPASVRLARGMVRDLCDGLRLPRLRYPAQLIISELATNAVEHVRAAFGVAVTLRGDVLHLAVQDQARQLPRPAARPLRGQRPMRRGAGLWVVDAAATAWGAVHCGGGKIVWATLAIGGKEMS